jgi:hypothetical protein
MSDVQDKARFILSGIFTKNAIVHPSRERQEKLTGSLSPVLGSSLLGPVPWGGVKYLNIRRNVGF